MVSVRQPRSSVLCADSDKDDRRAKSGYEHTMCRAMSTRKAFFGLIILHSSTRLGGSLTLPFFRYPIVTAWLICYNLAINPTPADMTYGESQVTEHS